MDIQRHRPGYVSNPIPPQPSEAEREARRLKVVLGLMAKDSRNISAQELQFAAQQAIIADLMVPAKRQEMA